MKKFCDTGRQPEMCFNFLGKIVVRERCQLFLVLLPRISALVPKAGEEKTLLEQHHRIIFCR